MLKEIITKTIPAEIKADHVIIRKAVYTAIEKAERYQTSLIVKQKGKIKEISPSALRRRLAK